MGSNKKELLHRFLTLDIEIPIMLKAFPNLPPYESRVSPLVQSHAAP